MVVLGVPLVKPWGGKLSFVAHPRLASPGLVGAQVPGGLPPQLGPRGGQRRHGQGHVLRAADGDRLKSPCGRTGVTGKSGEMD